MKIQRLLDLTGRIALVTGGGTNLGAAMAQTLAELGATVYIAGRRLEVCEQTAADLTTLGLDCLPRRCDVTDEDQVEDLVASIIAAHGRIDVLVCSAGGASALEAVDGPFFETRDDFMRALDVNMVGTYLCAKAVARPMMEQRRGSIVTLGSVYASLGIDRRVMAPEFARSGPSYKAAKGGVLNLTRALACQLGEYGVTVNCISPGRIPAGGPIPDLDAEYAEHSPLRRPGEPEDVMGAVALLASDAGRWITGTNLVVDGGWSAW